MISIQYRKQLSICDFLYNDKTFASSEISAKIYLSLLYKLNKVM